MATPRRRAISTPGERREPVPRGARTVLVSVALHVLLVVLLVQVTFVRADLIDSIMRRTPPTPVERVGFLQLPRGEPPRDVPRRGGDNRAVTPMLPAPPRIPVAPVNVPAALPPLPTGPLRAPVEIGTGPLVGGGGDTRGVRPSYTDPRLWAPIAPVVTAPLSAAARIDSTFAPIYRELVDSMRNALPTRDPTDWTFKVGGKKYGIDKQFIRLGPVSIPTAALAFLPLNVQGNPMMIERNRRLAYMREDIINQAARAARDDDFKQAVKGLRERKQKERDEAKKADPPAKIIP